MADGAERRVRWIRKGHLVHGQGWASLHPGVLAAWAVGALLVGGLIMSLRDA